jgi:hypothetical protein
MDETGEFEWFSGRITEAFLRVEPIGNYRPAQIDRRVSYDKNESAD